MPNISATFSCETRDNALKYIVMKRTVLSHIVKQNSKIIPLHTPIAELNVYCINYN